MFSIAVTDTYTIPVRVDLLDAKGIRKTQVFKAVFRRLKQDEIDRLNERINGGEVLDQQLIDENMVGWGDVADVNGNPLEFNPDNLAALLAINPTRKCLAKAFLDSIYGGAAKN